MGAGCRVAPADFYSFLSLTKKEQTCLKATNNVNTPTVYYLFFAVSRHFWTWGMLFWCGKTERQTDRQYVLRSVHMYTEKGVCAAYMCTLGSTYHRFPLGT